MLFLTEQEAKMTKDLEHRGVGLKKLQANPNKQLTITQTLAKINAENQEMRDLAKKACRSYIKSVHLMRDKEVFNVKKVDF